MTFPKLTSHYQRRISKKALGSYRIHARSEGFALANVLALSCIITMFATALLNALMPIYQRTSMLRNGEQARAVAEASLDYTIAQLNNSLAGGQINAMYDPGTTPGSSKQTTIDPGGTLGFNFGNNIKPQVTVLVENLPNFPNATYPAASAPYPTPPPAPFASQITNQSILYDPTLTSSAYSANSYLLQPGTTNVQGANYPSPYRRVTVTVILGSVVKNVRVILQPVVTAGTTQTNNNVGFAFGMFGTIMWELVGQAATNSYNSPDPRLFADCGTYGAGNEVGTGSVTRGVVEGGFHYEFPSSLGQQMQAINETCATFNAVPVAQAPWCQIMGDVYSNGDTTGYWPRAPATGGNANPAAAQPWNNTFGLPDGIYNGVPNGLGGTVPTSSNGWSGGIVTSYQNYAPPQLPPVPQAPVGATNLGSINLGANQTLTITPNATSPQLSGNNMQIPPGNYIVSSLSMSNGAQVIIDPATPTSTSFYLQGTNGGSTVMSVDNNSQINMNGLNVSGNTSMPNMNTTGNNGVSGSAAANQLAITPQSQISETSGSASQLQVFYNGTQNIYLLGNERMTVYAPNTTVQIGSQPLTNPANFYGGVVAAVPLVMSDFYSGAGAFFHADYKLRPQGMPQFIDPTNVSSVPIIITNFQPLITGYRAVTWQEAVGPNTDLSQVRWY